MLQYYKNFALIKSMIVLVICLLLIFSLKLLNITYGVTYIIGEIYLLGIVAINKIYKVRDK